MSETAATGSDNAFVSLADRARARAAADPQGVATYLEDGSTIRFGAVFAEAMAVAAALHKLGLQAGDVVSFQLPNWRETVAIDIACCWLGLVINPIIPIYREREVGHILADCQAKAIFIPDLYRNFNYLNMLEQLQADLPLLQHIILVRPALDSGGRLTYTDLLAPPAVLPPQAAVAPADTKLIMYTSGTTGRAKAVLHSHQSLANAIHNGVEGWQLGAGDVMLMPSPVTHITGYANGIELPFFSAARSAFMERWVVDAALDYIQRVSATVCVSATPFLQELVDAAAARGLALPTLRAFACGGASVPPSLITRTHQVLKNCRAFRVYGCTEAPLVSVGFLAPEQEQLAATTDGRVLNWDVRIVDDAGSDLALGQDGEVIVKGRAMMLGYGDAAQTREAVDARGYFHTGDIGHLTADGAIVITDRKKDIIIRGGENLSAREIEDVLHQHPQIIEVAAVAMPHPRLGEGVCVYTVTRDGQPLTLADLTPVLQQSGLSKQKWPEQIEHKLEMPKTASGKVRKDVLRQEIEAKLSAAARDGS